jgi:hypothetical protein
MYKLNEQGDYANIIGTGEWHNTTNNEQYLAWLAAGNTPEPYVIPPSAVPATVTRFQALATLAAGGWLDTVHVYIDALPRNNVQRLAFENATDWERTSPTLAALATMLGLTDAQVDDLFIAAAQVSA